MGWGSDYKRPAFVPESTEQILDTRIDAFRGVGPDRSAQLARLGLLTLDDLFRQRPRRHEDRRRWLPIRELTLDAPATVRGRVVAMGVKKFQRGARSVFELVVDDGTARLHCRWWNLPFMQNYFHVGQEVFVYGKPVNLRPRTIDHPETEGVEEGVDSYIHVNRIVPIYRLTEGLQQRWLRNFIFQKLAEYGDLIPEPWPGVVFENRPSIVSAIRQTHFPDSLGEMRQSRERLALDEFIALQIALQRRRRNLESRSKALPCAGDNRLIKPFLHKLGFTLTEGQTQVLREVRRDLGGPHPMRRLLQGDVGCGKTVVAACSALMVLESGYSVALMAPTEILAEQHHQNFQRWLAGAPIRVALQTGSRKTASAGPAGQPQLVIGTHALVEDAFSISNLGLVIIDEQHKFGVAQREALLKKGTYPHLLVMTATPIPRTLGLTLYGDLDLSVIQQAPGGRGVIRTFVRQTARLPKVWEFVREKLEEGRQAYVVYPRVEDAGKPGVKAVKEQFAKLREVFAPFEVGLLHGRLSAQWKQAVVTGLREKRIRVPVVTSVLDLSINATTASIMVVVNGE